MPHTLNALVIGYGSIGARHTRLLREIGCPTSVVTGHSIDLPDVFAEIVQGLTMWQPGYVVVANATYKHFATLQSLVALGYTGRVLVEKPVFSDVATLPELPFDRVAVAYNLRFHPLVGMLRDMLADKKVLSVHCYVGQYLPDWRPGTDYRSSYSSHAVEGGGVLRDLSHELDYLQYLFGRWLRVSAVGGHFSHLEGDSDDVFGLMMSCESCPLVQVQMNYLDRVGRRSLLINTDECTIAADFIAGTLIVDSRQEIIGIDRDFTYRAMHEAMLTDGFSVETRLCSLPEGIATTRLIAAAEIASRSSQWQFNRNQ